MWKHIVIETKIAMLRPLVVLRSICDVITAESVGGVAVVVPEYF